MINSKLNRRQFQAALASALMFGLSGPALAADLDALAADAKGKPAVLWYESTPTDNILSVIDAFNESYPDIEVQHVRIAGGNQMSTRVAQEMAGQGYSADITTVGGDQIWSMKADGLIVDTDWQDLGIASEVIESPFTLFTTAAVNVLLVNTNTISDDEIPHTWEEIVDPKWTGRVGSWVRPTAFSQLAAVIGVEQSRAYLEKLVAQKPLLFRSTYTLAQATAAGEVDLAIAFHHTAQDPISAGAPMKRVALDPTPIFSVYSSITKDARNESGAKLFLAWLHTPEGATAYEAATSRGNIRLPGTPAYEQFGTAKFAEYSPTQIDDFLKVDAEFNKIVAELGEGN